MIEFDETRRAAVLRLRGEFDLAVVYELQSALNRVLASDRPEIAIECGEVTFMDIAGARPLLSARMAAIRQGKDFVLLDPPPRVSFVLDIIGLGDAVLALEPSAWPMTHATDPHPPPHLTPPGPPD